MKTQQYRLLLDEIDAEIERGNRKHGHGELATPIQVVSILCEELGEYAQAVMQNRTEDARKELVQVVAVALNHLAGTGPHFSSK
jgi:NTP pyrophosphatase (non-canonical NTP hydrolase)